MRPVTIRKMVLRLPGLSPQHARLAGHLVARQLRLRLGRCKPENAIRAGRMGRVKISLSFPADPSPETLAEAAAEKIVSALADGTARERREE